MIDIDVKKHFYDWNEIKEKFPVKDAASWLRLNVNAEGRCAATWRGGDNERSVVLNDKTWHDFATGDGGSVIDLVARVHGCGEYRAAEIIGDYLGLKPKSSVQKEEPISIRVENLKKEGYQRVKEYIYQDENGDTVHIVERWEHPEKGKEFIQRRADGKYSLKDIKTYLYKLPDWLSSKYVCLCEGEKDVETLCKYGYKATCNPAGAGRWEAHYNEYLKDKEVIIFVDNDDAGRKRGSFLLYELKDIASKLKLVEFNGENKGFDVTDYIEKYGIEQFRKYVSEIPYIDKAKIKRPDDDYQALMRAKAANQTDFCNYIIFKDEEGKTIYKPRQLNEMVQDLYIRFLGFPKKIGNTNLFDYNRDTHEIEFIKDYIALFAWIMRKSKRLIQWKSGTGYVTKQEFFSAVVQNAEKYTEISYTPSYPERQDVYYAHPPFPSADTEHKYFNKLISFFNMADEHSLLTIKALFASPLWYEENIPRPMFIIDSETGHGSGKTTIAEMVAYLYNTEPVRVDKYQLKNNKSDIIKRLVSKSGRQKRVVLIDNVTGNFASPELADLVTSFYLSERPAYGHEEESRPNNLTYVITANSAIVDSDIADRALYAFVKKSIYDPHWQSNIINYIKEYRYHIIADIIDILEKHQYNPVKQCATRFPEFEAKIIMAFHSGNYEDYIKTMNKMKAESNIDEDIAGQIIDTVQGELLNININNEQPCFIRSEALKVIFKGQDIYTGSIIQCINNLAKRGLIPQIDPKIRKYPHNGKNRRMGIAWNFKFKEKGEKINIIGIDRHKKICVIPEI